MSKTKDKSLLYMKLQLKPSYPEQRPLLTVMTLIDFLMVGCTIDFFRILS